MAQKISRLFFSVNRERAQFLLYLRFLRYEPNQMIAQLNFLKYLLVGAAFVALFACHRTDATTKDKTPVNTGPSPEPSGVASPALETPSATPAASASPTP